MASGAGDNVMPRRMINTKRIRVSEGQRRGLHYVAASSCRIPNEGEIDFLFTTTEGFDESWEFQIADVNKPLGAVADRVDNACRVVYHKGMDTGQDLSYILNKRTGKILKMRRDGNVWVLDASTSLDMLSTDLFSRLG